MTEQKKKILVAEDDRSLAKALEFKLISSGYEVKYVFNGEEAIMAIVNEKFDLIILDLMIPKPDGFEILTEIKKRNIFTPVIVTSNLSQAEDMKTAKDLGATAYFVKSETPLFQLVENIKKII